MTVVAALRSLGLAELGWALLFSLPVGFGVAVAVLRQSRGRQPGLAVLAGLVTAVAIFLVVAMGVYDADAGE